MSVACQLLDWDSTLFDRRIARIEARQLTDEDIVMIFNWRRQHAVDCLYFLADAGHTSTIENVEKHGFGLKDIRLTYSSRVAPGRAGELPAGVHIRPVQSSDVSALMDIAANAHTDTRFYADQQFPRAAVSALYRTWIRKSCAANPDSVFVLISPSSHEPIGYIACDLDEGPIGRIGLIAIATEYRGQGLGQALVQAAMEWFADNDVRQVHVVTQGRNIAAQRLYQRMGFTSLSLQLWYHKWFNTRFNAKGALPNGISEHTL